MAEGQLSEAFNPQAHGAGARTHGINISWNDEETPDNPHGPPGGSEEQPEHLPLMVPPAWDEGDDSDIEDVRYRGVRQLHLKEAELDRNMARTIATIRPEERHQPMVQLLREEAAHGPQRPPWSAKICP